MLFRNFPPKTPFPGCQQTVIPHAISDLRCQRNKFRVSLTFIETNAGSYAIHIIKPSDGETLIHDTL